MGGGATGGIAGQPGVGWGGERERKNLAAEEDDALEAFVHGEVDGRVGDEDEPRARAPPQARRALGAPHVQQEPCQPQHPDEPARVVGGDGVI